MYSNLFHAQPLRQRFNYAAALSASPKFNNQSSHDDFSDFDTPGHTDHEQDRFSEFSTPDSHSPPTRKLIAQADFKQQLTSSQAQISISFPEKPSAIKFSPVRDQKSPEFKVLQREKNLESGSNHPLNEISQRQRPENQRDTARFKYLDSYKREHHQTESEHQGLPVIKKSPSFIKIEQYQSKATDRRNDLELESAKLRILELQRQTISLKTQIRELMETNADLKSKQQLSNQKMLKLQVAVAGQESSNGFIQASKKTKLGKIALLEEVAALQLKFAKVHSEMTEHKNRYEGFIRTVTEERRQQQLQLKKLREKKSKNHEQQDYKERFIEIFLGMLTKIDVNMDSSWSLKKKIAIGWKVIKFLIKKALKLGIKQPLIVQSNSLDEKSFI